MANGAPSDLVGRDLVPPEPMDTAALRPSCSAWLSRLLDSVPGLRTDLAPVLLGELGGELDTERRWRNRWTGEVVRAQDVIWYSQRDGARTQPGQGDCMIVFSTGYVTDRWLVLTPDVRRWEQEWEVADELA